MQIRFSIKSILDRGPNSYPLPSLSAVETFVKENKHLPGVQSRAEIEKAGAWNVSKNVRTNLEKIEELYLHTIAQEKEIEALKAKIDLFLNLLEGEEE